MSMSESVSEVLKNLVSEIQNHPPLKIQTDFAVCGSLHMLPLTIVLGRLMNQNDMIWEICIEYVALLGGKSFDSWTPSRVLHLIGKFGLYELGPSMVPITVVCLKSGLQKIRTFAFLQNRACPKNPDFYVLAKQDFSKKSGLLAFIKKPYTCESGF